jgi:hypothetical protein
MYVLQISRHAPESCPVYNAETRGPTLALLQAMEAMLAKHGVSLVGMWNDHAAHEVYSVYQTPSMDAMAAVGMEPEMGAWFAFNKIETKMVLGPEEIRAMFDLH